MEDDEEPSQEELERRRQSFQGYVRVLESESVRADPVAGERYACPCCRNVTLGERGGFEICPVCFWEDDGQDDRNADVVRGGPNGRLSLTAARLNYAAFGACEERFKKSVRDPLPSEKP